MKIRVMQSVLLVVMLLGLAQVQASPGYWSDSSGTVWRNSAGECWHDSSWTADMAIVGCDGKVAEAAAPPPAPAPAPVPAPAMTASEATVNFAFDRADLDGTATAALDTLVKQAKSQGRIKAVKLTGHADRIGTEEYNVDLSLRRASSVSDYLVNNGAVEREAVEIAGKGESMPLVGCEGVVGAEAIRCLAPNRRVEVMLELF
jgi:OOP family OmpA-OmpF porin